MFNKHLTLSLLIGLILVTNLFAESSEKTKLIPAATLSAQGSQSMTLRDQTLLSEGFEGTLDGWAYIDNDGDGSYWGIYEEDASNDMAYTGSRGAGVSYNASGNDDWLITPQIILPGDETSTFSFWARSDGGYNTLESFKVMVSTGTTDIADFSNMLSTENNISVDWTQYNYDLSAYAGQDVYIAVVCISVDQFYLWADDFLVESSTGAEEDYSIPLVAEYWGKAFSGPLEATTDGLKISTTGYRNGNRITSNQVFRLEGKDVYVKWLKHNGGSYMRGRIGIVNTAAGTGDISDFEADTWYYTRIRINADQSVEAVTSTGNYDDASSPGSVVESAPISISDENWYNVHNGNIYAYFDDTQNTEAYLTIGEVKISNSTPIYLESGTVYNFDNGSIPAEFTTTGAWSIDTSEPAGGNSLHIVGNVDDYVSFTVSNAAAVKVRYKIVHDGGDTAPLTATATSLMFSRNDVGAFWMGVYVNGTTAVPSEWCEFTVPANSLGDASFSLSFLTRDGQELWIDKIEVLNGSPVGIEDEPPFSATLPNKFSMQQNFPNPFNPSTTIQYTLAEAGQATLLIYDIRGNLVKTLVAESESAGSHTRLWNGMNDSGQPVSTGLYLAQLHSGASTQTIKMLMIK